MAYVRADGTVGEGKSRAGGPFGFLKRIVSGVVDVLKLFLSTMSPSRHSLPTNPNYRPPANTDRRGANIRRSTTTRITRVSGG
mmetsp:Transcript_6070/g.8932  ORF Transcript_6070/g.8932 Transcript_6070/m.8932 type:complete len:83 (-) Transcript_6070:890-1138(-)